MISMLREFTKSWIFTALMALLIASFAVFGLRDIFNPVNDSNVITAGKRTVTASDFKQRFDIIKQQQADQGQTITNEDFVKAGYHIQMLDDWAKQTALLAWLDKIGVKPSAKLVVDQIAKNPAFFDPVTGHFDRESYRKWLYQRQESEDSYENDARDQLAISQFFGAGMAGLKTPRIFSAAYASVVMQKRDTSLFVISPDSVDKPPVPTDAELQTYYNDNHAQWQLPEMRTALVVVFSPAAYVKSITIDEDALRKLYQTRLPSLVTPETRTFTEITAPNMNAAKAISDGLKAGKDAQTLAKANKGAVLPFIQKMQSDVPDTKIAAAAFAMKTGEISDPIQGSLGIAVVQMGDIKIGSTPSFESVRDQLKDDYVKDQAADKVNAVAQEFQKAHEAGDDFEATAKKLGLTVEPLLPMRPDGKAGPQQDYSHYGNLVKDVFDLQLNGTSDVEELGDGQFFALKLIKVDPAGAPPFEKVKDQLGQIWTMTKVTAAVQTASESAKARLTKGESIDAVAASYHAKVQKIDGLDRQMAQRGKMPDGLTSSIFGGQQGDVFTTPVGQMGPAGPVQIAVGHIDAVHQADPNAANVSTTVLGTQMSQAVENDIAELSQSSAKKVIKTATYPAAASRALGVTPPDPKAKDSKDAKSKS